MRTIYLRQAENERPGTDIRKIATAIGCESTKNPMNSAPSQQAVNLAGTQWTLEEIDRKPVIENSKATLAFLQAGRVSGNGSCNRFMGPAGVGGNQIKMGPLAGTKMMCEPAPSDQESTYLKAPEGAQRFAIQDGKLLVYVAGSDMPVSCRNGSGKQIASSCTDRTRRAWSATKGPWRHGIHGRRWRHRAGRRQLRDSCGAFLLRRFFQPDRQVRRAVAGIFLVRRGAR